jgi:hypothetical protein
VFSVKTAVHSTARSEKVVDEQLAILGLRVSQWAAPAHLSTRPRKYGRSMEVDIAFLALCLSAPVVRPVREPL